MALPRWLARFNRVVTNRLALPLAQWLPGYGVLVHTGRVSGREYRTPLNVFRRDGGYVIALTYGPESEWVKNVMAAGGCRLETRGRVVELGDPIVIHDRRLTGIPVLIRPILWMLGVAYVLSLSADPASAR